MIGRQVYVRRHHAARNGRRTHEKPSSRDRLEQALSRITDPKGEGARLS